MTISKVVRYFVARAWLACLIVFVAVSAALACDSGQATETEKKNAKEPPFQVRLLVVQRDWSGDQKIEREVLDSLHQRDGELSELEGVEPSGADVRAFLPEAGHAAVFEPQPFADLTQWLSEHKLLLNDQSIPLEATRFEGRWTGSIQPSWGNSARVDQVWHLEVNMFDSDDPAMAARISLQRTHARRSSPTGPRLRGAAIDIQKKVSFYLPKDRTVVMKWHAHPEDARRDGDAVEPILVFEAADVKKDRAPSAQFHLPERVVDLLLE